MSNTEPAAWVGQPHEGYVLNAEFSEQNKDTLESLMQLLNERFGPAVFTMLRDSLHITLFDWIAPLIDYDGIDKAALFEECRPMYHAALTDILQNQPPITITFDELRASPSTIFIVGHDNGSFQRIRDQFVDRVELLPNTKKPPEIIHSSLARFTESIALDGVEQFIRQQRLSFTQTVDSFRLVHTMREPMLEFQELKRYPLTMRA